MHGAAGAVGSMVTQLAREAGAYVIGTGRAADRQPALDFGANEFVDLDNEALEDVGQVNLVFDLIGGDIGKRSARLVRAGGTLVSIVGPSEARPADGLAVDFVVESDRAQLSEIVRRCATDDCGRTSATSRPSTMPSPPSTRPSGSRGKRSSAFVREDSGEGERFCPPRGSSSAACQDGPWSFAVVFTTRVTLGAFSPFRRSAFRAASSDRRFDATLERG